MTDTPYQDTKPNPAPEVLTPETNRSPSPISKPPPSPGIAQPQPTHQVPGNEFTPPHQPNRHGQAQVTRTVPLNTLGKYPALIDCPFCSQRSQTRIQEEHSSMTILAGVGIGLICICAACIPCLAHWCQDVDHFCSQCNQRVAHVPYSGMAQPVQPNPAPQGYHMGSTPQYGAPQQQQQQQQGPPYGQPIQGQQSGVA